MFALDDTVHTGFSTGPRTESTVALARGIFILLCIGLFIVNQALSQMCTLFTAPLCPPAWVHMLGCPFSSSSRTHREQLSPSTLDPEHQGDSCPVLKGQGVVRSPGGIDGEDAASTWDSIYWPQKSSLGHQRCTVLYHLIPRHITILSGLTGFSLLSSLEE